jgi:hypothetical protein
MNEITTTNKPAAPLAIQAAINEAQQNVLTQRTPPDALRWRKGRGGEQLVYVEQAWVNRQLNNAFGWNWDFSVVEWRLFPEADPSEAVVLGRLTVRTPEGVITKEQFGRVEIKKAKGTGLPLSVGDDLKGAASDAMKKCASMLGLGLDLMEKQEREFSASPERAKYWEAVKRENLDVQRALAGEAWAMGEENSPRALNKALKGLRTEKAARASDENTVDGEYTEGTPEPAASEAA